MPGSRSCGLGIRLDGSHPGAAPAQEVRHGPRQVTPTMGVTRCKRESAGAGKPKPPSSLGTEAGDRPDATTGITVADPRRLAAGPTRERERSADLSPAACTTPAASCGTRTCVKGHWEPQPRDAGIVPWTRSGRTHARVPSVAVRACRRCREPLVPPWLCPPYVRKQPAAARPSLAAHPAPGPEHTQASDSSAAQKALIDSLDGIRAIQDLAHAWPAEQADGLRNRSCSDQAALTHFPPQVTLHRIPGILGLSAGPPDPAVGAPAAAERRSPGTTTSIRPSRPARRSPLPASPEAQPAEQPPAAECQRSRN